MFVIEYIKSKEVIKIKNEQFLKILYRIKACLVHDDWCNARDYTRLEIKKLKNSIKKDC